ncbi:MAG: cysteine peptidase family C39 domain-containing protein [Patescibacteria group bacterium]
MKVKNIFKEHGLYIQKESYSCGPCSILNVLRLKGDFSRNEYELIKLCDAKPNRGTSRANMVKVANDVGLKVIEETEEASTKDLERNLGKGAYVIIAYWHAYDEVGHYGLITDYDDEAFYFADCDFGFIRIWKENLGKFWHNTDKTAHRWFMAVK